MFIHYTLYIPKIVQMSINHHIPVTRPYLPKIEKFIEYLEKVWDSRILSNRGTFHESYKEEMQKFLKVKHAYPFVNGTIALETAIKTLGLHGKEIITTPFTYVATTLAIMNTGNIPVFCDVKEDGCINEEKIEDLITEKTGALLPVHVYGNICNVKKIEEIAEKKDLYLIYDAAHVLGVEYPIDYGIGNYGDISVFSTHATKTLNTFEGGMLAYDNPEMDRIVKLSCNFGLDESYDLVYAGSNGKMNEVQAIMGILQLKEYDNIRNKRKKIVETYKKELSDIPSLTNFNSDDIIYNYIYYTILVENRNELQEELVRKGITTRKYFSPLTCDTTLLQKMQGHTNNVNKARYLSDRVLVIPLYAEMTEEETWKVIKEIRKKAEIPTAV